MNLLKTALIAAASLCAAMSASCQSAPSASQGATPQASVTSLDGYRLGTGDEIKVTVFDEPTLSGTFTVDGLGAITMNLIQSVQVKDLTFQEAGQAIAARYKDGWLRDPRVTAEMVKGRPYYILGEINKAGEYPYTAGLTVMNAIAAAGDFTYRADKRKIMITSAQDGAEREVQLTPTTPVRPGDRIRIRERLF